MKKGGGKRRVKQGEKKGRMIGKKKRGKKVALHRIETGPLSLRDVS